MAKNTKLKVGFVFDDTLDSFDGVAQYVKTVGAWLSAQGHEVRYLVGQTKSSEWAGGKIYSLAKNQKITFNGNQARIPLPANSKSIQTVLENEKFDVLHVQVPYSPFLAQKIINRAGPDVGIVGTFHVVAGSFLSKVGSPLLRLMYGLSLNKFDAVVSVSSAAAKHAWSAFGLETNISPDVFDYQKFADAAKRSSARTNQILFFGRLVKRKGAKELIEAYSILHQYDKEPRLVIAGDGPERRSLEGLVRNLGLEESVSFLGFIEEDDKPALLASADIVCFPSLYGESFGIVLLEAMAAGAGVVLAGNNPGYSSIFKDRPQALFNPANDTEFASKLSEFLDNEELAKELHVWQQVEVKKYDINAVGPNILKLYIDAIANHHQKRHN